MISHVMLPGTAPPRQATDHAKCDRPKIGDEKVANRPIYVALAVTRDGAATSSDSGPWTLGRGSPLVTGGPVGEGAKYWLHILTEIKTRGVGLSAVMSEVLRRFRRPCTTTVLTPQEVPDGLNGTRT